MRNPTNTKRGAMALAAFALLFASCGGGEDAGPATTVPVATVPTTEAPTTEAPTTEAPTTVPVATTDAAADDAGEETTAPPTTEEQSVFDLEIGLCYQGNTGSDVRTLDEISCAEEHLFEVYAKFDIIGIDWPGAEEISAQTEAGCLERFDAYVGIEYAQSLYYIQPLTPTEEGWNEINDREVICMLERQDDIPNIGTAKDSGI